ncbi:HAD family hydrolase [Bacillus sp. KH172YL63]|uniref:HAD family hydrolase n=1 Tax=Bacillus sp. KH172YL63 TaxID=2709784 RepID=UPI0013E4EBD3|nr:HAD family hydrolase [Bacillus sp. KH172YL63]BCB03728.1 haloacid dehalogenase [Bacillus sp. KH172YL63]
MNNLSLDDYDVVMFDLDDTLFDHVQAYSKGLEVAIRQFEHLDDISTSDFQTAFTRHHHLLWPKFAGNQMDYQELSRVRMENTLSDVGGEMKGEALLQLVKAFQASYLDQIKPDRELNDFLADIQRSVFIGIITNGTVSNAYEKVRRLGLSGLFPADSVVVSEDVGFSKPDPRIFRHALHRFNASPNRTLFVGDHYHADILGAISIGMDTVWVQQIDSSPLIEKPHYIVKRILELKPLML